MHILHYQENNVNTADLYLEENCIAKLSTLVPSTISITQFFEPDRNRVERFIQDVYKTNYDANISVEYPILMSVRNAKDEILAALGIRYAANETLFLEQYLNSPIETYLDGDRKEIIEIGNLASAGKGASAFLFAALAAYLNHQGVKFASVTGTRFLHSYFKRIGLNPKEIGCADMAKVNGANSNWGTYYDTQPRVLVGGVQTGLKRLKTMMGAEFRTCPMPLFPRLHYKM
jgi:hypothetical protein